MFIIFWYVVEINWSKKLHLKLSPLLGINAIWKFNFSQSNISLKVTFTVLSFLMEIQRKIFINTWEFYTIMNAILCKCLYCFNYP